MPAFEAAEVQGCSTHCFAEAHLVSQDAAHAVLVQGAEPLDALQLVVSQLAMYERQQCLQQTRHSRCQTKKAVAQSVDLGQGWPPT